MRSFPASATPSRLPYPVRWIDRWTLPDGRAVTVRPVLAQDLQLESEFVARGLTAQSRYLRFQTGLRELPPALAQYLTDVDYHDHFALVAESFEGGTHVQVGDARFVRDGAVPDRAEFAIAVADAWQGLGLGERLLRRILEVAQANQVSAVFGDVLHANTPMLKLAQRLGFRAGRHPDDARLARLVRTLDGDAPGRAAVLSPAPSTAH